MTHDSELRRKFDLAMESKEEFASVMVHPAWHAFLKFCMELRHGEIDRLCIQDGLPVLAEVTRKKVKFSK